MYNFFVGDDGVRDDGYVIAGTDRDHIANVLRMRVGDRIYVSFRGQTDLCAITAIDGSEVSASVVEKSAVSTELPARIILFQGIPKGDRMELLIQKTVELGVYEIVPVEMKRSIVRLDEKRKRSKQQRWQSVAESAAKQSKRNIVPAVAEVIPFREMLKKAADCDLFLVPYENTHGMAETKEALLLLKPGMTVGVLIGPEGGFENDEIEAAVEAGGRAISLGSRILRVETASIAAVGMLAFALEMR